MVLPMRSPRRHYGGNLSLSAATPRAGWDGWDDTRALTPFATIGPMTDSHGGATSSTDVAEAAGPAPAPVTSIRVLLFSDDSATRDAVRLGVGRRPARDVEVSVVARVRDRRPRSWRRSRAAGSTCWSSTASRRPIGGLGLAKQLKNEIFDCPPILVLTGRPQDALARGLVAGRPRRAAPARPHRAGARRGRPGSPHGPCRLTSPRPMSDADRRRDAYLADVLTDADRRHRPRHRAAPSGR